MLLIGVTGPIASGKSTVCKVFAELGAFVIDADKLGHEVLEEPSIKVELIEFFGDDVVNDDGTINRSRIASLVFSNERALRFLEKVTHRVLVERLSDRIDELRSSKFPGIVVLDAAMLPKWPVLQEKLDYLVLVESPRWQRANRLIQDRGLPQEQCDRRLDAQAPLFDKITSQIDYIVKNNGDLAELKAKAVKVWLDIKKKME
ncbi:dephospho-CoA kinase [bacterium]|nr:MAG: dephospho-CoA kinase [bacterium]